MNLSVFVSNTVSKMYVSSVSMSENKPSPKAVTDNSNHDIKKTSLKPLNKHKKPLFMNFVWLIQYI